MKKRQEPESSLHFLRYTLRTGIGSSFFAKKSKNRNPEKVFFKKKASLNLKSEWRTWEKAQMEKRGHIYYKKSCLFK